MLNYLIGPCTHPRREWFFEPTRWQLSVDGFICTTVVGDCDGHGRTLSRRLPWPETLCRNCGKRTQSAEYCGTCCSPRGRLISAAKLGVSQRTIRRRRHCAEQRRADSERQSELGTQRIWPKQRDTITHWLPVRYVYVHVESNIRYPNNIRARSWWDNVSPRLRH